LKETPLVNTDVDRHSLEYRVASLTVLNAFQDARAIGANNVKYFDANPKTSLGKARYLARQWQDLRQAVCFPVFAGMLRVVGMPVEETRRRIIAVARGMVDG
jgi:hypothetical protein